MSPATRRYVIAGLIVLLAVGLRLSLHPLLGDHLPFLAFYPAVLLATWLGGLGPGLVTVGSCTVLAGLLFVAPSAPWPDADVWEWLSLAVFASLGGLFCLLAHRIRGDAARLRRERERSDRGRDRAERQLRELNQRLDLAQRAGKVGFFEYDFQRARVRYTGALGELMGSRRTVEEVSWRTWARRIVAEDSKALIAAIRDWVANGREDVSYEFRARLPVDGLCWLAGSGRIAYDDEGRPERMTGAVVDFTARRRIEEAWRESEEHYRSIFDQAAVGIARLALDRTLLDVNPGLCEMLGYERSQLIGQCLRDLTHPEDRASADGAVRSIVSGGAENASLEQRFRHHDRSHLWTHATLTPIRDEQGRVRSLVTVVRDITSQLRTEATLRFLAEASSLLSAVGDERSMLSRLATLAVPDFADWCAVDLIGSDGKLERIAVAQAQETAGVAQPLLAMVAGGGPVAIAPSPTYSGVARVLRSGQPEWLPSTSEATRRSAAPAEELRALRERGFQSYLCVPLCVEGRSVGALSFGLAESGRRYDDGDLAAAQDLAHRVGTAIENAQLYQELRQADRRKDEFLATLGHELRNPLVPIRSGIDLLAMEPGGPTEITTLMRQQVEHLIRLVDDLLDVSRIARGRVELRRQPVTLAKVLEQAAAAMHDALATHEQELTLSLPADDPWLDADPIRLVQVIENLLQNASKFSARGGRIALEGRREQHEAVIVVRDWGIGIEPELLPHIFEPFTQSNRSLGQGGLGIGLALVRGLVEVHGGTVAASSSGAGCGSEFVVRLPVAAHQPETASEKAARSRHRATEGRRILVVDDNVEAARMLDLLLRRMGPHQVATAHDGPAALSKLLVFDPEVVLLDIGLPGMDGHEVGRRIRKDPHHGGVLMVALTGYGQEEDRRRSRQAGFDWHLVKPPSLEDIERVLAHPKLLSMSEVHRG